MVNFFTHISLIGLTRGLIIVVTLIFFIVCILEKFSNSKIKRDQQ